MAEGAGRAGKAQPHDGAPTTLDLSAPDDSGTTAAPPDCPTATGGSDTPAATGGVGNGGPTGTGEADATDGVQCGTGFRGIIRGRDETGCGRQQRLHPHIERSSAVNSPLESLQHGQVGRRILRKGEVELVTNAATSWLGGNGDAMGIRLLVATILRLPAGCAMRVSGVVSP
ncbi:MAG: hypothetical protein ABSF35_24985 [Polyangia bacterium]|jgi:hypothetical protein